MRVQPSWESKDVRRLPSGEAINVAISLDELACEGARRMIATALEAEVADYVERFVERSQTTAGGWWFATAGRVSAS